MELRTSDVRKGSPKHVEVALPGDVAGDGGGGKVQFAAGVRVEGWAIGGCNVARARGAGIGGGAEANG